MVVATIQLSFQAESMKPYLNVNGVLNYLRIMILHKTVLSPTLFTTNVISHRNKYQ